MKDKKTAIIVVKWLFLGIVVASAFIFFFRVVMFLIIDSIDKQTYPNTGDSKPKRIVSIKAPICPGQNEILKLKEYTTDIFSIKIPEALIKKDTSFFATPTWLFACRTSSDGPKDAESVRIYIETGGPFDIKTFQTKADCLSYFDELYEKDGSKFTASLIETDFKKYSNEFNQCYIKHSLTMPNGKGLIFERLVLLPNSLTTKAKQYDVYTYYPSDTHQNITEALGESINSFKLK